MSRKKRMQYRGMSRDVQYNPWMRLIHGSHYDVEKHEMKTGKIRLRVTDGFETVRITYDKLEDFRKDWC